MLEECAKYLESIIKPIVNYPEDVKVGKITDNRGVLLTLEVNENDIPTVIGKDGKFAQAVRVLLRTFGSKKDALIHYKIITE